MAAHIEQRGFRPIAQGDDIDTGRHGEQDVAQIDALGFGVSRRMGSIVTAALVFRRIGNDQRLLQQLLDGRRGGLAQDAFAAGRVVYVGPTADLSDPAPVRIYGPIPPRPVLPIEVPA